MAYKLSEINAAVRQDPVAFMEECDRRYQDKVAKAAEKICENMKKSPGGAAVRPLRARARPPRRKS